MKLNEITVPSMNGGGIVSWLKKMQITNYTIQPNGIVDVDDDVDISLRHLTHIPCQFGKVNGKFECSFRNFPSDIGGFLSCSSLPNLTSFHNIHKIVKSISEEFLCDDNIIKSHVLGLLLIKNLTRVDGIKDVEHIINKYLPLGDIHLCQEELIQAGFPEYAKL